MRQELLRLRDKMEEKHINTYLIPTTDFHGSEYVSDFFKCREYVSGFTGSAGTLVVTADEAKLWTDGRYFLQAAAQLTDSGIELVRMGEPESPTILEYLSSVLVDGSCLGFDGRVVDCAFVREVERISSQRRITFQYDVDLVGEIWIDRPTIIPSRIYSLSDSVTGETHASKLTRLRDDMKKRGVDYHLVTKMDEIAWLYNLRGADVANTPVFFAFALIEQEKSRLYVMDQSCDNEDCLPYYRVFEDLKKLKTGTILLDESVVSYSLMKSLPNGMTIINDRNPIELMKSLKNPIEIESTKKAHIKDGAAMVNFIHWLKRNIGKIPMTEISVSEYLESCRRAQDGCFDLSFSTISGYGPNGAIVHYSATEETNRALKEEGLILVDSGGQYEEGTTDITRTIVLGPLTDKMKEHYTLVLRAHIHLAMTKFAPGTTGAQLDVRAREPIHQAGLDFMHGTGHGVGHILSVHEGPQSISAKGTASPLYPGMITSNEPGLYMEGEYGIRLENEILCRETENGLYDFETITFCPFDREAILPELLTEEERSWLDCYHHQVYERVSPLLDDEIKAWLRKETRAL